MSGTINQSSAHDGDHNTPATDSMRPGAGGEAAGGQTAAPDRKYLLERVDDAAVVQLYVDGFDRLPLREKVLAWHLYQAALAGRDIYFDQRYAHNLEMRDVLEEILTHAGEVDPGTLAEIQRYTKLFWLNTGPYNNLTARKFVLRCTPDALAAAAEAARLAGASFPLRDGESFRDLLARLEPMFFDPARDPIVTNKTPGPGRDILASSANNLYVGVTTKDLEGFDERYPLNSRLVKRDDALVEEVYRVGGRYDQQIRRIVGHLEAAIPYSTPAMAQALEALVRYYRTGETADRVAYDIAWVRDRDSPIDTINGFVEVYMDPRGHKGAWEALVYYVNPEKTEGIRRLAAEAQWFEDRMPWADEYKKQGVLGVTANAIDVVVEAGDSAPVTPVGINLPNDQLIREQYGSKSVSLTNVNDAYDRSTAPEFRREFAWTPEEAARAEKWSSAAGELTTNMHEVIGHGSGRIADRLQGSPQTALQEQYSALEESRADLVALYFLPDPKLVELGLVEAQDHSEIVLAEYEGYARNALVQLRRVREGTQIEEDHMRNRQMVVHWLMANTGAIEKRTRDGKTYYVVVDVDAFRVGVGRLLTEVQRIKAEGDYTAARHLFDSYGIHFDPQLRDEIVERVDHLNMPSYTGFVQPRLEPVRAADGRITDVRVTYPLDLTAQMLEYSAGAPDRMHKAAGLAVALILLSGGGPQRESGLVRRSPQGEGGPSLVERRIRILAVEDGRAPTAGEIQLVTAAATASGSGREELELRLHAIRALGHMARPQTVSTLTELTAHSDDEIRSEAAIALALTLRGGTIEANEPLFGATIDRLLKMPRPPPAVIGNLPYTRPDDALAAESLLRASIDKLANPPAPPVRAMEALARRNRKLLKLSDETVSALTRIATRLVRTDAPPARRSAMATLLAAGVGDEEIIATVLGDEDAEVRRLAALALSAGGTTADPAARADLVRTALQDRSPLVRYEAVRAWARVASAANGCGPLVEALADDSMHVVLAALDALGERCRDDQEITDRLTVESRTPPTIGSWHREAHAFVALARRSRERAVVSMSAFALHQVWEVRMYAARAATLLGDTAVLERLAHDTHPNVRTAALPPLRALQGDQSEAAFVSALGERDYELLRTAATSLKGAAPTRQLRTALVEALQRVTKEGKDTSRDTRLALLERIGELGGEETAVALEPLARDFDPVVAAAAAATSALLTGRVVEVRPVLRPRPRLPDGIELSDLSNVRVVLDNGRTFDIELHPDRPLTTTRFRRLVLAGYYNGLTFHRVVPNFVVQGGSPGANEYEGDGPFMRDELGAAGHERGTVGISTRGRDTGDAQIFVNLVDNARLDFDYTVMGRVRARDMPAVDSIQEGTRIVRITPIPAGR